MFPSRIGLKLSLVSALVICAVIGGMTRILMAQAEGSAREAMRVRAEAFSRTCREAMLPRLDVFALHFAVQEAVKEPAVVYAAVLDGRGRVLSHSDPRRIGETLAGVARRYDISAPILAGTRELGTVRVGFTDESVASALSRTRRRLLSVAAAAVALAVLATTLVVGWLMRPLPALARAARAVGEGRFDVSVGYRSWDELGEISAAFDAMTAGLRERERLRAAFGRFVPAKVAEQSLRGELRLGGARCEVSVLITDIRDFTRLSESLPPEEVVAFLNDYFFRMVAVILNYGGSVDKFLGDGILAVFGAPLPLPDHAARAAACALELRAMLSEFNADRRGRGAAPVVTGMAIHSGVVVAGTVGCAERLEYTVIGDTVNLASRLEGLNLRLGTQIVVSGDTARLTRDRFSYRPLGLTYVRGRQAPVRVYELLSRRGDGSIAPAAGLEGCGGLWPEEADALVRRPPQA